MYIEPVITKSQGNLFYKISFLFYKNSPHWIAPLKKDINKVFDKNKNKAFRYGEVERWILLDDKKKPIGRIAAFINKKYKNKGDKRKIGGIGFFECIENQLAANLLFDTAKKWLQERSMEAMDGPINFGERDNWWGLLVEGFHSPLYGMNYNLPYYKKLFEDYGFGMFFQQYCFGRNIADFNNQKMYERHAWVEKEYPHIKMQVIEKKKLKKYVEDFVIIYNKAWSGHGGFKKISFKEIWGSFKKMKSILDENLCYFIYDKEEPIGVFINMPELNDIFKYFNGKLGWWEKLKLIWMIKRGFCKRITGMVFGIVPEWQGKGIDNFMIIEMHKIILKNKMKYENYEMQWLGDFNPKIINLAKNLGTECTRKLITYRYNFNDPTVERHPIL
ncbi:MAG: hypothetical protein ACRC0A_07370 [Chitinophagaceae bacterium]